MEPRFDIPEPEKTLRKLLDNCRYRNEALHEAAALKGMRFFEHPDGKITLEFDKETELKLSQLSDKLDTIMERLKLKNENKLEQLSKAEKEIKSGFVGEIVKSKYGDYPVLQWKDGYVAKIGDKYYLEPQPQPAEPEKSVHIDDIGVDKFAEEMKSKLQYSRDVKGRGGWKTACAEQLSNSLRKHVEKGDPIDVANLAMMLHQNGYSITPAETLKPIAYATINKQGDITRTIKKADRWSRVPLFIKPVSSDLVLTWHERAALEKVELDHKITKIKIYLRSKAATTIDLSHRESLKEQLDVMKKYSKILGDRMMQKHS